VTAAELMRAGPVRYRAHFATGRVTFCDSAPTLLQRAALRAHLASYGTLRREGRGRAELEAEFAGLTRADLERIEADGIAPGQMELGATL